MPPAACDPLDRGSAVAAQLLTFGAAAALLGVAALGGRGGGGAEGGEGGGRALEEGVGGGGGGAQLAGAESAPGLPGAAEAAWEEEADGSTVGDAEQLGWGEEEEGEEEWGSEGAGVEAVMEDVEEEEAARLGEEVWPAEAAEEGEVPGWGEEEEGEEAEEAEEEEG